MINCSHNTRYLSSSEWKLEPDIYFYVYVVLLIRELQLREKCFRGNGINQKEKEQQSNHYHTLH